MEYPIRKGINLMLLLRSLKRGISAQELAAFAQTWLFFGLLCDVLGKPIKKSDYTRVGQSGILVISTKKLPSDLKTWWSWMRLQPEEVLKETESRISGHFNMASRVLRALDKMTEDTLLEEALGFLDPDSPRQTPQSILPTEVVLSVEILLETIESCARVKKVWMTLPSLWSSSKLLEEKMRENGYCPYTIQQLRPSLLYYASYMKPVGPPKAHGSCSVNECLANRVDKGYTPQHVHKDCPCALIGIDLRAVLDVLARGGVPLVDCSLDDSGRLRVIEATSSTPYVAISHVWADGLGNMEDNAMPMCQLMKLRHKVDDLPNTDETPLVDRFVQIFVSWLPFSTTERGNPTRFWIDTLCVPVKSSDRRNAAIRNMHKVYKGAKSVLVLDAGLQECTVKATPSENLIRIAMSSWASRLWTLQEAALARNIGFVFAEQVLDGLALFQDSFSRTDSIEGPFCRFLINPYDMLLWMPVIEWSSSRTWMKIMFSALQFRSTSKRDDEALCIAILVNHDPDRLLNVRGERRFQTLLSMLEEIPADIIFLRGQRLSIPGYRWAVSSLMVPYSDRIVPLKTDQYGRRTSQGLIVRFPGLLMLPLTAPIPPEADQLYVTNAEQSASYQLSFELKAFGSNWEHKLGPQAGNPQTEAGMTLAVILPHALTLASSTNALLCNVVGQDNELLRVHSLQIIKIVRFTNQVREHVIRIQTLGGKELEHGELIDDCCILRGDATGVDQTWCID